MRGARPWLGHVAAVVVGYACFVAWLSWPLAGALQDRLPCPTAACSYDTRYSAWVLAFESHALWTSPSSFADANIYHPAPDALFYGPTGLGALPYFAPVYLLSGNPVLALDVTLLLCIALTAAALHLVVQRWTGLDSAGFVAALTLLTNRWLLWGFVGSTPHLAALQYLPVLLYLAAAELERPRQLGVLFLLLVLQVATDTVYVALAAAAPLGVLAAARIVRPRWRASGVKLALVLAASLLALTPIYLGYARVRAANPDLANQTVWPAMEPPLDLSGMLWGSPSSGPPTTIGPIATLLIVAGLLALWRGRGGAHAAPARAWQHAALWTVVGVFLSLTPVVLVFGHGLWLPRFYLAFAAPFFSVIRAPSRLAITALVGLCVLTGLAFAEVARLAERLLATRHARQGLRSALCVTVSVLLYVVPPAGARRLPAAYPTQEGALVPSALHAALAARSGPLLQLPVLDGSRPSRVENARAMLQSTTHWRPLLNGYSSYWPVGFPERMDLAAKLPDGDALAALVEQTGLTSVWVDLTALLPAQRRKWHLPADELRRRGLTLVASDATNLLFDVGARPPPRAP